MACTEYTCFDCGEFWHDNMCNKCPACGSTNFKGFFDEGGNADLEILILIFLFAAMCTYWTMVF